MYCMSKNCLPTWLSWVVSAAYSCQDAHDLPFYDRAAPSSQLVMWNEVHGEGFVDCFQDLHGQEVDGRTIAVKLDKFA